VNYTWVSTTGGFPILMGRQMVSLWRGGFGPENASIDDYSRASEVRDDAEFIPLGNDKVLVLGDEPADTTGWLEDRGRLVLARWHSGPEDLDMKFATNIVRSRGMRRVEGQLQSQGGLILFDSAADRAAPDMTDIMVFPVDDGEYVVDVGRHHIFGEWEITAVVLSRVERS